MGFKPRHRRADAEAGEAVLGDRGVDHPLVAELLHQVAAHLVGALVLGDLLAHQEDVRIAPHLLGHGVAQRVAHGDAHQLGACGDLRVGLRRRGRNRRGALPFRLRFRALRRLLFGIAGGSFALALAPSSAARTPPPAGEEISTVLPLRGSCRRRRLRGHRRRNAIAALQPGDRGVDLHLLGPLGHQERLDHALVDRLDLHGRLVGLDLGDHVAGPHRIADLHVPLGERALLHGGRQGRHQHVGHPASFLKELRRTGPHPP